MAMNLDALLRIKASVSGEQAIKQLGRSMEGVSGKVRNIGDSFEGAGKSLEVFSRGLAALAAGQAIRGIVQGAAQFDQAVRTAAAIASSGGGDFQGAFTQLKTEIQAVASAAAGTPVEVANLAVALQRAGFSVTETSQSLRGIVAGAEATGITFEEMGSITADTLRQFGLDTTQTMRVVDLLADSANSANQRVQDVGEAMKYAAPIAKNLGVSVEDTAATIALLAEAGIRGSDAGTALRTGLTRLQIAAGGADSEVADLTRGNKQLTEAMSALGSQILDTEGKLKPLDQVIMALKAGMDGLSATDQAVLAKALFGMEAGSKFIALINQSSESIRRMFGDMRDAGGEATETQKKMQGFAYGMEVLNGNIQNVSNSIGNQFMAAMMPAVDIVNKMLSAANDLPEPTKEFAAQLAAVGLAAGAVTLALRTLIPLLRTFVGLMGALKIGGLLAAGPWFALAAGIAAVAVALNNAANAQQAFDRTMATGSLGDVRKQVMKLQEQVAADQEVLDRTEAGSREQAFAQARLDARKAALEQARKAYRQRLNQPAVPKPAAAEIPSVTTPVPTDAAKPDAAADKAAKAAENAAEAALKERERVAGVIRDRMAEAEIMKLKSEQQDRIAAAERAGDQMLVARLRGQERELDIQYRYAQELMRENDLEAQKAIIYQGQVEMVANQRDTQRTLAELAAAADQRRFDALQQYVEKQYELNTAVQQQQALADGVANTLGQGMASAFDGLITGAENWGESLRQIAAGALQDIAKQLIRIFIIEQAISGIKTFLTPFSASTPIGAGGGQVGKFGTLGPNYGIPQRANGGPVMGGSPYLVGERGPELFVPGRTGMIVPNNQISSGTSVTVNVDASGSSVQGNDQQAGQLGRAIAAAVQQELVKQKRPGGLLAR
jgi:TP901 family phage tail tape measure protein